MEFSLYETCHVRMVAQQAGNRTPQGAGAVTVNNSHLAQTRKRCFIKKFINCINGFIGRLADNVQLRSTALLHRGEMNFCSG